MKVIVRHLVKHPYAYVTFFGTFAIASIPLIFNTHFYALGDTETQFIPTWFHLGESFMKAEWPLWVDADTWVGGNYVGEGLYGIYTPVSVPIWVTMASIDNLIVGITLVKLVLLSLLALGTYLLARDYETDGPIASLMAICVPLSGFALYWDSATWVGGLLAFAHIPYVWLVWRRAIYGTMALPWAFVAGALVVLQGNPFGLMGAAICGLCLAIESAIQARWSSLVRLGVVGIVTALVLPLVFGPLIALAPFTERAHRTTSFISLNGMLRPPVADLFQLSSPWYEPSFATFVSPPAYAVYFCWFLIPLLPWLNYSKIGDVLRRKSAPLIFGVIFTSLMFGPARIWMFRWPVRYSEYAFLGFALALALMLNSGILINRWRVRLGCSFVLIALPVLIESSAVSFVPEILPALFLFLLFLIPVGALLLIKNSTGVLSLALGAVTVLILVSQVARIPQNPTFRRWDFPTSVSKINADHRYSVGNLVQLGSPPQKTEIASYGWGPRLGGSMYAVAGVAALNSYAGMGYRDFSRETCIMYNGFTKPCRTVESWFTDKIGDRSLVDLLKVNTMVLSEPYASALGDVPSGWRSEREGDIVTLRRKGVGEWPNSRLANATGVKIEEAHSSGPSDEEVWVLPSQRQGHLTFAMLAWPGYRASLDGKAIDVNASEIGLLTVAVPAGSQGRLELSYRPPYWGLSLGLGGLWVLVTASLSIWLSLGWRRRRRS